MRFHVDLIPDRERIIVAPVGEIDMATAPQMLEAIEDLLERGFDQVVVDLRRVEFLGSQGIKVLPAARDRARPVEAPVSVIVGDGVTHRVLEISEVLRDLDVTQ